MDKTVYIKQTTITSLFEQARIGAIKLGYETVYYKEVPDTIAKDDVLIGFIEDTFNALDKLGLQRPKPIDYPAELEYYFSRRIMRCNINDIINYPDFWPVFIKPVKHKLFTGRVIKEFKDLIGTVDCEVYYSDPIEILSEWRVYVLDGKIAGIKNYKNNTENQIYTFDKNFAEEIIKEYKTAPKSYSLDIGIDEINRPFLIEVNDGFSLGNYGIDEVTYAKMLIARYEEIVNKTF